MLSGSTPSFRRVEIIVRRTEWLVCYPLSPAASLIDFMNEQREFLPKDCFLNQVCEAGLRMVAR